MLRHWNRKWLLPKRVGSVVLHPRRRGLRSTGNHETESAMLLSRNPLPLWFVSPKRSDQKQRPQRTDGGGPDSGDRAAALAENPVSPVWRLLGKSGHSTALQSRKKRKKKKKTRDELLTQADLGSCEGLRSHMPFSSSGKALERHAREAVKGIVTHPQLLQQTPCSAVL